MKKIIILFILSVTSATIVGCSNKEEATNKSVDYESSSSFIPTLATEEPTVESSSKEVVEIDYSGKIIAFSLASIQSKDNSDTVWEYKYNLSEVDSNSGSLTTIKEFPVFKGQKEEVISLPSFNENIANNRTGFDKAFNKLAYTELISDGSTHVGWIDEVGNKTDVTSQISGQVGFADSVTKHLNPRFIDDNFYFTDETEERAKVMFVPVDDISSKNMSEFNNPYSENESDTLYPTATGGYINYETNINNLAKEIKSHAISETRPNGQTAEGIFVSWLDEDCILTNEMMSQNVETGEETSLLPDNSRSNSSLIASSDGKEILFLSKLGSDNAEAYIVSTEGSEPRKLSSYEPMKAVNGITAKRYFIQWNNR